MPDQAPRRGNPTWRKGQSANPSGRLSVAERLRQTEARARVLAVDLGGWDAMSATDRLLLTQAAALAVRRPRTHEDQVRVANTISKLLAQVLRRHGPAKATPGLGQLLRDNRP